MTAPQNLNQLRRGAIYRATTRVGIAIGEYLGMEAPHGDRAILLRHGYGTESIALSEVTSIRPLLA
jgi:hypothetical protein